MNQTRLIVSRHQLLRLALVLALVLAATNGLAAHSAWAETPSTAHSAASSSSGSEDASSLVAKINDTAAAEERLVSAQDADMASTLALPGRVVDVLPGETYEETLTSPAERTYQIQLDEPDLVGIKLSASGTTTDADGVVGTVTVYEGDDTHIDVISLFQDETEECWYYLPAGTYRLLYVQSGTDGSRDVSVYWEQKNLGLSEDQVVSPGHRIYSNPAPIANNVQVQGIFYWGISNANNPYLDSHYYEFTLPSDSNVSIVLGTSSPAMIALWQNEEDVYVSDEDLPLVKNVDTHYSLPCGTLKAGKYRFSVMSSDVASWKHTFTVEVVTTPTDTYAAFDAPVLRLYNETTGEHFFTRSAAEKQTLINDGWKNEGVAWVSPETASTIVWRLKNPYTGEHLYTPDTTEKSTLITAGWEDEDIAWYSDNAQRIPVYRLFNPYADNVSSHHYTTDSNEYATLQELGWQQEGVVWYGMSMS